MARCQDDGIPYEMDSPFCCAKTTITVRQSKSLEDREIGKQFVPLWRVLAKQLKILFPGGDDEGAFIVPLLDARSQVLSITDRRNGIGKPGFKLASLGSGQTFTLVAPDLCGPGVSPEVLQRVSLSSQHGQCVMPAISPFPLFRRLAGRGAIFRGFPFRLVLQLCALFDSQRIRA